jgi:MFS family permease
MADTNTMNFQAYLVNTFRAMKEEPVILILGGLLVYLLTMVSMGLLAGPLIGGYFLLFILYLRDNRKPTLNGIFAGLQQFTNLFPYFLVLLLILLGFMLLILPGLLFATWWLYVLPLMADRKIPFNEAMRLSMNKVNEAGFLMHFVFLLLISVIPFLLIDMVSTVIPFLLVLKFLLPPFQAGCLASLYIDQFHTPAASTFPGPGNEPVSENGITPPSGQEEAADHSATAAEKNITESSDATSDLEHNKKIDGIGEIKDENREDGSP